MENARGVSRQLKRNRSRGNQGIAAVVTEGKTITIVQYNCTAGSTLKGYLECASAHVVMCQELHYRIDHMEDFKRWAATRGWGVAGSLALPGVGDGTRGGVAILVRANQLGMTNVEMVVEGEALDGEEAQPGKIKRFIMDLLFFFFFFCLI